MKILICDPNYAPVVASIRTFLLIKVRGWQKRGARVTFICSTEAKKFYQEKLPEVEFFTFPFVWKSKGPRTAPLEYLRANFLAFPFLFKMKGKFDIVYSLSSTLDIIFFPWVLKLVDRSVKWFTVMDNIVPKPSERPGNYLLKVIPYIAFLISNLLLKKTDGMFVVTNLLKKYYQKKGINVIKTGTGNGLDIDCFRGRISSQTPKFNALFGGRLHPAKGVFDLIEIMKEIIKKEKNYTLAIMGQGDNQTTKKLLDAIQENNLIKNIFLLGHKETKERWDLYRSSDFFLFPSYAEGCPQVVLEAFAANKLVIGYNLIEYRDAFKKYLKSGQLVIFKKGDTSSIAKYILSVKNKQSFSSNKKFHFYNKLSDYSWEKIVDREWKVFLGCKDEKNR